MNPGIYGIERRQFQMPAGLLGSPASVPTVYSWPAATSRFDPRLISNCTGWWDAANSGSITLNGSTVSAWANLVAGGTAYVQTVASAQPTVGVIGSMPALRFSPATNLLGPAFSQLADTANNALSIFLIVRQTVGTSSRLIAVPSSLGTPGFGVYVFYTNNQAYFDPPESTARINGSISGTTISSSATIVRLVRNGATVTMHYNGSQIASRANASGNLTSNFSESVWLGMQDSGSGLSFVSEIIYYSRGLSAPEITTVERGLAAKYGRVAA